MTLLDLEINEPFKVHGSRLTGKLLEKNEMSSLVIIDNATSFDNDGNEIKTKQKMRISTDTEVRRLDVNN